MLIKLFNNYLFDADDEGAGGTATGDGQQTQDTSQQTQEGSGLDAIIARTETPEQRQGTGAPTDDNQRQQGTQQTNQAGTQGGAGNRQTQQGTSQGNNNQRTAQGTPRGSRAAPNGDLVDPVTGAVIARAGSERRLFEQAREANQRLNAAAREVENLQTQLTTLKEANNLGTSLGLDGNDQVMALQLMASYKKDPVGTIRFMLTEAQAAGHNLASVLGQPGQGSFDPAVIGRMLDERLAPFTSKMEDEQRWQQAQADGASETNQFFQQYPDAKLHEQVLVALMQKEMDTVPQAQWMSLREHYYALQNWALRNGLDWSKPLNEQVGAHGNANGQQQSQRPMLSHGAPMTGRTGAPHQQPRNTAVFNSTSSADIVREAMREAGLEV